MRLYTLASYLILPAAAVAAGQTPFTTASVEANLAREHFARRTSDDSLLSVNTTLRSPDGETWLSINNAAQASYGILRTAASSKLAHPGAAFKANSGAEAGFGDSITITYPVLDGQPGLLYVSYTLSGSASSSSPDAAYAEVQIAAGDLLEHQYSTRHSSAEWGVFTLPAAVNFTYGTPFGFNAALTARVENGPGADMVAEKLVLSSLAPTDQFGNPVRGAQFASASGTPYGPNGVMPSNNSTPVDTKPVISSVRPASGPVGTVVTVSGSGFLPTSGIQNSPDADYGGNTVELGPDIVLKNRNSPDGVTLDFEIPKNASPGIHSLRITNSNGPSNTVTLTVTEK